VRAADPRKIEIENHGVVKIIAASLDLTGQYAGKSAEFDNGGRASWIDEVRVITQPSGRGLFAGNAWHFKFNLRSIGNRSWRAVRIARPDHGPLQHFLRHKIF
jgi:hypothetical protein